MARLTELLAGSRSIHQECFRSRKGQMDGFNSFQLSEMCQRWHSSWHISVGIQSYICFTFILVYCSSSLIARTHARVEITHFSTSCIMRAWEARGHRPSSWFLKAGFSICKSHQCTKDHQFQCLTLVIINSNLCLKSGLYKTNNISL